MAPPQNNDWVRRFAVSNPRKHKKGFTIYKVTSIMFPKGSPEAASRIVVWKRYNDFKKLYQELKTKHQQLHLKGTFPSFAKAKMFGRFDDQVVEERRKCALSVLEFIGEHMPLFTSDICVHFLNSGYPVDDANALPNHSEIYSPASVPTETISPLTPVVQVEESPAYLPISVNSLEPNTLLGGTWKFPQVPDSISLSSASSDEHTTFTDTDSSVVSGVSTPLQSADLQFFDPLQQSPTKLPLPRADNGKDLGVPNQETNSWLLSTSASSCVKTDLTGSNIDVRQSLNISKPETVKGHTELPAKSFLSVRTEDFQTSNLSKLHQTTADETPETALARPFSPSDLDDESLNQNVNYIFEAAYHVGQAQLNEANGEFEAAFAFYKAGIACLLCGVQDETDVKRKVVVSKKISKYLLHAEKLYVYHLGSRAEPHVRRQLSRPVSELRCYRVLGTVGRLMLVMNTVEDRCYVIKVLQKSSCPVDPDPRTIVPQNVPYMVAMHRYFETDSAVYLVLQHASGGRLWQHINSYFQSLPATPVRILSKGNAYLGKKLMDDPRHKIKSPVHNRSGKSQTTTNVNIVPFNDPSDSISGQDQSYLDLIRDYTTSSKTTSNITQESSKISIENDSVTYNNFKMNSDYLGISRPNDNCSALGGLKESISNVEIAVEVDYSDSANEIKDCFEDKTDSSLNNNPAPDLLAHNNNAWKALDAFPTGDLVKNAQRLLESVSETLSHSESVASRLENERCVEERWRCESPGRGRERGDQRLLESVSETLSHGESVASRLETERCAEEGIEERGRSESPGRGRERGDSAEVISRSAEKKCLSKRRRSVQSSERRRYSNDDVVVGCGRGTSGSLDRDPQWSRLLSEQDRPKPRLPESTVRAWAAELLVCLETLHRWGVTCRDLRPDNILLGEKGHLQVTYMCRWEGVDSVACPAAVKRLYAAPEVNGIFPHTHVADWWSYGALVYELITGKSLHTSHPGGMQSHTIVNVPDDVSDSAKSLLEELLRHNPLERLGSGVNGAEDLKSHPFFNGVDWQAVLDAGTLASDK